MELDADRCFQKIVQRDDVAVHVAGQPVLRQILGPVERPIEARRAEFVVFDLGDVKRSDLLGGFRNAGLVAEDDDLAFRLEVGPTAQRVRLDHADMPGERLRYGEDG